MALCLPLMQWFSTGMRKGGDFAPFSHPGDNLVVDDWEGTARIKSIETRNAAKHLTMNGIAPTPAKKNDLTHNVHSAEAEKSCFSEYPNCFS